MKKLIAAALTASLLGSLVCFNAFAAESPMSDWLDKLEALTTEEETTLSDNTSEDGGYSAKDLYAMVSPKVVEIITYDAQEQPYSRGTGFFIDNKGTVVTNYHVIEDSMSATIQMNDGDIYNVTQVLGYDNILDLALLKTDISGNEYLEISGEAVATGETVYTLGSSLGLTGTFSDGMVSTASRVIDGVDYIQITAPISSGNSGGPLINVFGEVIGVNTWTYVDGQNLNFAININQLSKLPLDHSITMEEFFYETEDLPSSSNTGSEATDADIEAWYADADYEEVESNDSFEWADILFNDYWTAGAVENISDMDTFKIHVTAATNLSVVMLPLYTDDSELIITVLLNSDQDILDYGIADETESGAHYQYIDAGIEDPGDYYIAVLVPDDYPYSDPAYYQISCAW